MLRVCVVLVMVCVVGAGSLSGRGFFCRDPDTGKLHPINSTWPASSFCGNFHCKLRRKNITGVEYASRQINITNVKPFDELTEKTLKNNTIFTQSDFSPKVISIKKKPEADTIDEVFPLTKNKAVKAEDNNEVKNKTENDRYLSDTEIKTLTEILHTVKKSDLDAIVEIYNLAQDIYKEIETPVPSQEMNDKLYTGKTVNNYRNDIVQKPKKNIELSQDRVSYWYEPLSNSKIRPADLIRTDMSKTETRRSDMMPLIPAMPTRLEERGNKIIDMVQKPYKPVAPMPVVPSVSPVPMNKIRKMSDNYFNGPFSHKDFGKLPYYYPMSSFQRLSSYLHHQKQNKIASPNLAIVNTVSKPATHKPPYSPTGRYQKEIKPSVLLPYPFSYIHHYNWSNPQNIYSVHRNNLKEKYNSRRKENNNNAADNYNGKRVPKSNDNAVLMNPYLENFQDLEVKPPKIKEEKVSIANLLQKIHDNNLKPDWQSDSLPKEILEEVSAHVQDKNGLGIHQFPLRKKVKMERVGRYIKVDDHARNKRWANRHVENDERPLKPELYEVFIERTTCNADYSVPGFFRYGNLSQPYPECCPQRITTR